MHQKILNYNLHGALINDHGHEITFGRFYYILFSKIPSIENIFQTYFILRIFAVFVISILYLIKITIIKYYKEYESYIFIPFSLIIIWFCFLVVDYLLDSMQLLVFVFYFFFSLLKFKR